MPNEMDYSDLKFKTPIVASDGNFVMINNDGIVNLLFFQMRGSSNNRPGADVVAGVRLHNLQELKNLVKTIQETIDKHENREP